jgi:predicted metal-dependent hydrolase
MESKKRFDPYYNDYAFLAIQAAVEIDNMPRNPQYRLDKVRELGELLLDAVEQSQQNSDFGFYTLHDFKKAFQEPLEQADYRLNQHTQVEPLRQDLLRGIHQIATNLKRFAYGYGQDQENAQRLMRFCNSLCKKLSEIRHQGLSCLAAFQEGLVEHGLHKRSRETGQTYEQRLEEELSDIDRFSQEMPKIRDPEMKEIVMGLSSFARAFYRLTRRKGLDNYQETAQAVNKYFFEMDRTFYGELQGKENDMRQLVDHLNELSV